MAKIKPNHIEYGKLPPQAVDIEEAILSIIMNNSNNPDILPTINKFLRIDVFYKNCNQKIFESIIDLYNNDKPYDMLMVLEELRRKNTLEDAGGPYAIALISQKGGSINSLEHYCAYIFELYLRREMIRILTDKVNDAYNLSVDVVDLYNDLHTQIEVLFGFLDDDMVHRIDQTVDRAIQEMQMINKGMLESTVKCGYRLFDDVGCTSIYDIINISSPRSAGKTRFMISIIKGFLEHNKNISVQWWSMEDSDTKIIRAFASSDTQLSDQQMLGKNYKLSEEELHKVRKAMDKYKAYDIEIINEQETIANISRSFLKFIKRRADKINILIIDDIMLIEDIYNNPGNNQTAVEDKVAGTIRKIINKSKRANRKTIIIFLHHMTKEMESKFNQEEAYRPKLSHMKGTTRFADIATTIYLLNKTGMYKDLIKKHSSLADIPCINSEGKPMMVKREVLLRALLIVEIAKNRDGEVTDERITISRLITDFAKMKFNELKVNV